MVLFWLLLAVIFGRREDVSLYCSSIGWFREEFSIEIIHFLINDDISHKHLLSAALMWGCHCQTSVGRLRTGWGPPAGCLKINQQQHCLMCPPPLWTSIPQLLLPPLLHEFHWETYASHTVMIFQSFLSVGSWVPYSPGGLETVKRISVLKWDTIFCRWRLECERSAERDGNRPVSLDDLTVLHQLSRYAKQRDSSSLFMFLLMKHPHTVKNTRTHTHTHTTPWAR